VRPAEPVRRGTQRGRSVLALGAAAIVLLAGDIADEQVRPAAADAEIAHVAKRSVFPWQRRTAQASRWAKGRHGVVSFAVIDARGVLHTRHASRRFPSASVVKALLLVAYLDRPSVRHRRLGQGERGLLAPMIRTSDNDAASRVMSVVGVAGLRHLAHRARLRNFTPSSTWGNTQITAADMARFFWRIDRLLPARHRGFALHLLRTIVPAQRWGVPRARPSGWRTYLKGGWRGALTHQAALLRRGRNRISIAVLTAGPGNAYGQRTIEGVTARVLRGLNRHRLPTAR
jgi:hypothetical protein